MKQCPFVNPRQSFSIVVAVHSKCKGRVLHLNASDWPEAVKPTKVKNSV